MRSAVAYGLAVAVLVTACTPADGDGSDDGSGAAGSGASSGSGPSSGSGASSPGALPPTTFVFERKVPSVGDHLVAMDYVSGEQRIITTLAEGNVAGWAIDGAAVSPDRTRIVIATGYGATAEDVATQLATNRLWSMDTDGGDFRRLTPVFPNNGGGRAGWRIDVRNPAFSADGQIVMYDYGEGDFQSGYVAPWYVSAAGDSLPMLFQTSFSCSINGNGVFNPATGDLLLVHSVCVPGTPSGYHAYPIAGGPPVYLVNEEGVSLSSEPPAIAFDGSAFVFTARSYADDIQSLYAYIFSGQQVVPIVLGADGIDIVNAAFAPDNAHMVYCVREGDTFNLRLIDFGVDPPSDTALTDDGVSCDPVF